MTSSSSVKELPPGDPKLTASIVSHLKSRGLFDKLRRDCLGDVDTKPAYLNLKQRIEGYITKFLSTQTWTPDMNKNHVRDMMRREINESGMLSAGMDHLVDQIVNPKIYHVFTPEVENGVRQYLGLSSEKDSSTQQPETDSINQPPPPQTPALPPLPPKSEFSIDETTQDVPSSCSPKPYTEALMPDVLTDSSSEHQLMIVTESNEHTEDIPVELPAETAESYEFCETSAEPVDNAPNETSEQPTPGPVDNLESDSQAVSQSGSADDRPVTEDFELPASLDDIKSDPLKKEATVNEFDSKDTGVVADTTKVEVKRIDKDKKERKIDSVKGKESSSHSGRSDSHSKSSTSKKTSDTSRSKMQKSNKCDSDSSRESRDLLKERDKYSISRDRGSSREETQRNRADATKDERGERSKGYSSQSSRSKESDSRNERKRTDDKHRHYSSSQRHDDRKRDSDRHSREDKSRDRSDSRRSHGESKRDKDRSSTRDSSRQHKSSKSSEKHGESSRKERSHEKEKKQAHSKQSSSDSKDGETLQKMPSEKVLQTVSRNLLQAADDASFYTQMPETLKTQPAEMNANASVSSQYDHTDVCQDASMETPMNVLQENSEENISCCADQTGAKICESMCAPISQETSLTVSDESSHGALQLVEAKEAEILRFSYVSDKQLGSSGTDLQLVSADTEKQAEGMLLEERKVDNEVQVENSEQASSSSHAAPLEQESPTVEDRHETARRKTTTEMHSPEKKRPRRDASDGHESDGAWSDVTVSSVHTSDLSSYDDCISVSSGDEDDSAASREKKKIPLREIKKITSSSNEDDDRMSRSETEHCASDGVVPTTPSIEQATEQHEAPESAKESQPHCPEPYESSSSARGLSNSPSTDVSDAMVKPKMGLRRTRKINPKYVSEEFSSIFTAGKGPAGTIDFSELAKYGKEKHHEERSSSRTEHRKISREDAPEDTAPAMSCDETDQLSDASVNDRSRRPTRRPSGGEPRARSESMSSKCYQSSDLYKPRPIIKPGTRRSRPSSGGVDAAPKKQRGLKVCIGFKRGRTSSTGSSRRKRL
uniref:U4/u6 associated splicing factor prp4 n=1 Tax=Rhipicephalus zambeziensis TaxID=60191 RepID=A0A224Z977_9ACAR